MTLPVFDVQQQLLETLASHSITLLQAPPGAGKTTQIPLWLHQVSKQKILLVEPRRLAVLNAARQLAGHFKEEPGKTVGYRMRLETKVSKDTQIEVVTEGSFIRMIQHNPELSQYSHVVLDEFHERHLQTDLSLAFLRSTLEVYNPKLKVLLMSATLDGNKLAEALNAPLVVSDGRMHPVETHYLRKTPEHWSTPVPELVEEALNTTQGNLLIIVPGIRDIQNLVSILSNKFPTIETLSLHGSSSWQEQKSALANNNATRRITVSSPVTESSVTLPNVSCVIDSGKARFPKFNRNTGLTRLVTSDISRSSADQRKGRAGREGPGQCYRLWTHEQEQRRIDQSEPEITNCDYLTLVLECALWGESVFDLEWLSPPNKTTIETAITTLNQLGALKAGHITPTGEDALKLGLDIRLGIMLTSELANQSHSLATTLATVIQENLYSKGELDGRSLNKLIQTKSAQQILRNLQKKFSTHTSPDTNADIGDLLVQAYPDRVALKSGATYKLSSGIRAHLSHPSSPDWLLALSIFNKGNQHHIDTWVPLHWPKPVAIDEAWLNQRALKLSLSQSLEADVNNGVLSGYQVKRLGEIGLSRSPFEPSAEDAVNCWIDWLSKHPWIEGLKAEELQLINRMHLASTISPDQLPFVDKHWLQTHLSQWLSPFLPGLKKLSQIPFKDALTNILSYEQQNLLNKEYPATVLINGRNRALNYQDSGKVTLAIKLQEMFGCCDGPVLGQGRYTVTLELLSPAGRPLQVTQDLGHFWRTSYQEVKKEMKGRYPKHPWPDDPITAEPSSGTKKQNALKTQQT